MKSKSVAIDGRNYEVREPTMREMLPVMETEPENLSIEMIKHFVTVDGNPLGEDALDLGWATFQKLVTVMNEVSGVVTEPGND